jgi:hypothetical protein
MAISIGDIFQKLGIKGYDDLKEAEKKSYLAAELDGCGDLNSKSETQNSNLEKRNSKADPSLRPR